MNYINTNKQAWEEAFDKRKKGWGEDHAQQLDEQIFPFIEPEMITAVSRFEWQGKRIAQFCCNNGRELLSIVKGAGCADGTGLDIAENIIAQAQTLALETSIPCTFKACSVLEAPSEYHGQFDAVLMMVGAITWFESLPELFRQVSLCLKKGGRFVLHEIHPFADMLAVPGEDIYDANQPMKIAYSYFRKEPFEDNFGMMYLSGESYQSKTFTCFSHTMGAIITSLVQSGFRVESLEEFDRDVGGNNELTSGKGFPFSYILSAEKQ